METMESVNKLPLQTKALGKRLFRASRGELVSEFGLD